MPDDLKETDNPSARDNAQDIMQKTIPIRDENMQTQQEAILAQQEQERQTDLLDADVLTDDDLNLGSVYLQGKLRLTEEESGTVFEFSGDMLQQISIGRADGVSGHQPDVDLTPHGARERGVSRHHATIIRRDDVLIITDHKSMNGTFINGKRIAPEKARVLRDGDVLHISSMRLDITFQ